MRIIETKDAFSCVKLGRLTYHRHTRSLIDGSGLTLFTLKHVDSVIFEILIINSSKGIKTSSEILLSAGWPDRRVSLSSVTMKVTSLRKMLNISDYDIVAVKNVGYYIPNLSVENIEFETKDDVVDINTEVKVEQQQGLDSESRVMNVASVKINRISRIIRYCVSLFCFFIFSMIIYHWDSGL